MSATLVTIQTNEKVMGRSSTTDSSSSSSSIDSSRVPYNHQLYHHHQQQQQQQRRSCRTFINNSNRDLSTDLRLGLSLTPSSANAAAAAPTNFFVKVYMEGIPIGRKLDLFAHHGYQGLVITLTRMFRTSILYPGIDRVHSDQNHVLTYEDKEGDLMMVGDVPWDLFLRTVKRLKITRSDNC